MNEVNIENIEEAIRDPKRFERRDTVELPIPPNTVEREASRREFEAREKAKRDFEARAAQVRATGAVEAWRGAHSPEPTVDDVLEQRNGVHGDFADDATTAQQLKAIVHDGKNWGAMPTVHREALEQMMTKVARILSGDFNHLDHWKDLQGYPRLVELWIEANTTK